MKVPNHQTFLVAVVLISAITTIVCVNVDNILPHTNRASTFVPDYVCVISQSENCDLGNYGMGDIVQV